VNRERVAALAGLAALVRDRDLAALAEAATACRTLAADLSAGRAALAGRAAEVASLDVPDPAMRSGADRAWHEAQRRRLASVSAALAGAAAEREAVRAAALRTLGRADVLGRMRDGKL
jgi:hypothetical protein